MSCVSAVIARRGENQRSGQDSDGTAELLRGAP